MNGFHNQEAVGGVYQNHAVGGSRAEGRDGALSGRRDSSYLAAGDLCDKGRPLAGACPGHLHTCQNSLPYHAPPRREAVHVGRRTAARVLLHVEVVSVLQVELCGFLFRKGLSHMGPSSVQGV